MGENDRRSRAMTRSVMKTAKTGTRKPVQKSATKSAQNRNEKTNAKSSTRIGVSSKALKALIASLEHQRHDIAWMLIELHRTYSARVQSLVRDWQAAIDNARSTGADVGSFAPVLMCATCLDVPAVIPIAGTDPDLPPFWCSYVCAAEYAIQQRRTARQLDDRQQQQQQQQQRMRAMRASDHSVRDVLTGNARLVMYSTRDLDEADRRRSSEIRRMKYERQVERRHPSKSVRTRR